MLCDAIILVWLTEKGRLAEAKAACPVTRLAHNRAEMNERLVSFSSPRPHKKQLKSLFRLGFEGMVHHGEEGMGQRRAQPWQQEGEAAFSHLSGCAGVRQRGRLGYKPHGPFLS